MGDVRVTAASGTAAEWAASPLVLGVGQFAWETDTQILRVGDGTNTEQNLEIVAQVGTPLGPQIDDNPADVSGSSLWSSLNTQAQINAALVAANAYTDSAVRGVSQGQQPRLDVCFQNSDGTWPNRPSAYCIFAFTTNGSTTPPSWLAAGIDELFYRA